MKKCPMCGSNVERNFCPECGFNISSVSEYVEMSSETISHDSLEIESNVEYEKNSMVGESESFVQEENVCTNEGKVEIVNYIESRNAPLQNERSAENDDKPKTLTQKAWFTILMLIVFAPVGIFLMWKNKHFGKIIRIVLSALFGIIFLFWLFLIIVLLMPCPHEWQEATCTTPKCCTICEEIEGEALGHTEGEWELTKEATLVDVGVEELLCSVCETSLDSRGTERKKAKVKNGIFNFNDKELVDWINSWEKKFEVDESKIHIDSLGEKNTCYKVTLTSTGSEGILILNHEKDIEGNVSAVMTYFDDYLESTAFVSVIAKNIESDFSVETAGENLIDKDLAYVVGNINVMRINLSSDMEVALLAPLEYIGEILGDAKLTKNDGLVSVENTVSELKDYNYNVWEHIQHEYGVGSYWFYDDDGDSVGVDDIGSMKTFRGIELGESTEEDLIAAYGNGNVEIFDRSTDVLYQTMLHHGLNHTKYLEDTKKVRIYNYNDSKQIVMYIDDDGIVDFIAYLIGEWY